MAIQERKAPSPSDLKTKPQSFTKEELKQLRDLKSNLNQTAISFGQVAISKLKLEEAEITLKRQLAELEKKEVSIAKKLSSKYGKGSIDIETGTFIPS